MLRILPLFVFLQVSAQTYFPPINSSSWDTITPSALGWCSDNIDSLNIFLEENNTKAFILLKDGKIVLEKYMNGQTQSDTWYWASAGKVITASLIGIAEEDGLLSIHDPSSQYLGNGWTSLSQQAEDAITIWHQLTMTSGLNDQNVDLDCTDPACLTYLADAGDRWSYHNAPYTLLLSVLNSAVSLTANQYVNTKIHSQIGTSGIFVPIGFNRVFFSNARSMARFGLLCLAEGVWAGTSIIPSDFFSDMVNTSQVHNEAYGYLWWLNGKNSFQVPGLGFNFSGPLFEHAPNDTYAAMGLNGQFINVSPSQGLVWIRMGESPDSSLVPITFNDQIWEKINNLPCPVSTNESNKPAQINIYPNPAQTTLYIDGAQEVQSICIYDVTGRAIQKPNFQKGETSIQLDITTLAPGTYTVLYVEKERGVQTSLFLKE